MTLKITPQAVMLNGLKLDPAPLATILADWLGPNWNQLDHLAGDWISTDLTSVDRAAAFFVLPNGGAPPQQVLNDIEYSQFRRELMRTETYAQALKEKLEPSVPVSVSNYQAKKALKDAGLLGQANALIAALGPTHDATLAWNNGNNFYREDAWINQMGTQLGLSSEQIDDLFRAAKQIL